MAFIVMIGSVVILMVFNSGRAVNEKARLVNAADAATYSAGIEIARQLNFIAYTNRAMMANQIAAGHFTSFMSEADYAIKGINSIPILGPLLSLITTPILNLAKSLFGTYIVAENQLNLIFSDAQQTNFDAIKNSHLIHNTLEAIVQGHENFTDEYLLLDTVTPDGNNGLNQLLADYPTDTSVAAKVALVKNQEAQMQGFIAMTDPVNDNGKMIQLINSSISTLPSAAWFNDRRALLGLKTGSSKLVAANGGLDWQANDDINLLGIHGSASAAVLLKNSVTCVLFPTEKSCTDGYKGIAKYAVLSNAALANSNASKIDIVAFVQKNLNESLDGSLDNDHQLKQIHSSYGDKVTTPEKNSLRAFSHATVYYERPKCETSTCTVGFATKTTVEYPNLFNPFWQVGMSIN